MSPNGLADDMAGATVAVAMLNFKDASIAPQAVLEQAKVDLKVSWTLSWKIQLRS